MNTIKMFVSALLLTFLFASVYSCGGDGDNKAEKKDNTEQTQIQKQPEQKLDNTDKRSAGGQLTASTTIGSRPSYKMPKGIHSNNIGGHNFIFTIWDILPVGSAWADDYNIIWKNETEVYYIVNRRMHDKVNRNPGTINKIGTRDNKYLFDDLAPADTLNGYYYIVGKPTDRCDYIEFCVQATSKDSYGNEFVRYSPDWWMDKTLITATSHKYPDCGSEMSKQAALNSSGAGQ